jgi:cytoskeletal protein RodZ
MANKLGDAGEPRLGVGWEETETGFSGGSQKSLRADSGRASILPAMTPREIAREHANRKRARIHRIRVRVATLTVTLFIAVFAVIYVQMVQGHDPVLAKNTTTSASSAASASTGSASSDDGSSSSDDGSSFDDQSSSSSSSDQSSSSSSPAPVQTTQS